MIRRLRRLRRFLIERRVDGLIGQMIRHGGGHPCDYEDCHMWNALCAQLDDAYDALARIRAEA